MKNRLMLTALVAAMSFGLVLCGVGTVFAKATGACSTCHTMHDSQDGAAMATGGPNSKLLLKDTCLGCHTGTNNGSNTIPFVYTASGYNYGTGLDEGTGTEASANTLAGGNFAWVENGSASTTLDDDVLGHNVAELTNNTDAVHVAAGGPPGWSASYIANGTVNETADGTNQLTCAGTNGCHGTHDTVDQFAAVSGGHHGDDSTIDGLTVAKSYRFLKGIIGFEDSDWEYQATASTHNQYHGEARTASGAPTDTSTISYLCAECHGNFHSGSGNIHSGTAVGTPWLRHPTDYDLSDATGVEYASYNVDKSYSVVAPVASDQGASVTNTGSTGDLATVALSGSNAIVTCISCHRAHGTPYPDMLRWDSATAEAATDTGDNTGCLICHTAK